jgi:hypothetical protein
VWGIRCSLVMKNWTFPLMALMALTVAYITWRFAGLQNKESLVDPSSTKSAPKEQKPLLATQAPSPLQQFSAENTPQSSEKDEFKPKKLDESKGPIPSQGLALLNALSKPGLTESLLKDRAKKEGPMYRDVFADLGLSPSQIEELISLVDRRRKSTTEARLSPTSLKAPTNGDVQEAQRKSEAAEAEGTKLILEKLGNDDRRSRFTRWETTLPQRQRVAALEERLGRTFPAEAVERIVDGLASQSRETTLLLRDRDNAVLRKQVLESWKTQIGDVLTQAEMEEWLNRITTPKQRSQPPVHE